MASRQLQSAASNTWVLCCASQCAWYTLHALGSVVVSGERPGERPVWALFVRKGAGVSHSHEWEGVPWGEPLISRVEAEEYCQWWCVFTGVGLTGLDGRQFPAASVISVGKYHMQWCARRSNNCSSSRSASSDSDWQALWAKEPRQKKWKDSSSYILSLLK